MAEIKALLFDCDGVLLDSERVIKQEVHEYLNNDENYNLSYEDFYKETRGQSIKATIEYLNNLGVNVGQEFFDYFESLFIESYTKITTKIPNVEETLKTLNHLPKAVCSNGLVELYTDTLEHHGIKHYFNEFFGIETTEHLKPAPDMFLQAAESLNTPIENCLIIDDSYLTGVPAGRASNAGVVVGFASDEFVENQMMVDAGADYVIRNLNELPDIVNKHS